MDSFSVYEIWGVDISTVFYGTGTKTTGKQTFPRESLGSELELRISTVTIWVGT